MRSHLFPRYGRRQFLGRAIAASAAVLLSQTARATDNSATWISTTESAPWRKQSLREPGWRWDTLDLHVKSEPAGPSIDGFGGCFNELGWTSLSALDARDREAIFEELFAPGKGANFSICRMPVGANDFSRKWYSYDETPGDLGLKDFSIANDRETLIPFIHAAQRYQPKLRLWASPWSPPSWMKRNKAYAEAMQRDGLEPNGLRADQAGKEGEDMFVQEPAYFASYAEYFGKFIDAYKREGIHIGMVMPQNEFNSAQAFPSCTWTPEGLTRFIRHLGPAMKERGVEVFFGTLERGNPELLGKVMNDPKAGQWIKGVGMQWAGKAAVADVHARYPQLCIYQSEQECGDGKNE